MTEKQQTPLISIVTVTLNNAVGLEKTLKSIEAQVFQDYEVIVIDGVSTDNTKDVVAAHKDLVSVFTSEKDNGIFDAMNKGTRLAKGDWVIYMNAGDLFFAPDTLERVAPLLTNDIELLYGANAYDYNDQIPKFRIRKVSNIWKGMPCSHQSLFVRRNLLQSNPFDPKYRIASDYNFIAKCYYTGKIIKQVPFSISITEPGGLSDKKRLAMLREQSVIIEQYDKNPVNYLARLARYFIEWLKTKILPK